jgi:hypothetical protein
MLQWVALMPKKSTAGARINHGYILEENPMWNDVIIC